MHLRWKRRRFTPAGGWRSFDFCTVDSKPCRKGRRTENGKYSAQAAAHAQPGKEQVPAACFGGLAGCDPSYTASLGRRVTRSRHD